MVRTKPLAHVLVIDEGWPPAYAKAAEGLAKASSAARALFGGAEHIERVDCLVRRIARQKGLQSETLDDMVMLVDERLAKNRSVERASS